MTKHPEILSCVPENVRAFVIEYWERREAEGKRPARDPVGDRLVSDGRMTEVWEKLTNRAKIPEDLMVFYLRTVELAMRWPAYQRIGERSDEYKKAAEAASKLADQLGGLAVPQELQLVYESWVAQVTKTPRETPILEMGANPALPADFTSNLQDALRTYHRRVTLLLSDYELTLPPKLGGGTARRVFVARGLSRLFRERFGGPLDALVGITASIATNHPGDVMGARQARERVQTTGLKHRLTHLLSRKK